MHNQTQIYIQHLTKLNPKVSAEGHGGPARKVKAIPLMSSVSYISHAPKEQLVNLETRHSRDFPKMDHSGRTARIVLEQSKFNQKVTSNSAHLCVYSLMPCQLC